MDRFPSEFEDLLNARGRRLLADSPPLEDLMARRRTPILFFDSVIDRSVAADCIRLMDEAMRPRLRRMHSPIPRTALTGMTENYSEALSKTLRVRTATLNSGSSKALDGAREIGLDRMMASASFLRYTQALTKPPLRKDHWSRQIICYEAGDYSGPHNDHHPERPEACNGFLDFHIMFSNAAVAHQLLVYEERHFLSASREVSRGASIAVYRLPFWHYTTPLIARPRREQDARRWLLLGSFDYDPPLERLEY
jgi:hypothetical protein